MAAWLVSQFLAPPNPSHIHLRTTESWASLKNRFRGFIAPEPIIALLPPLDHYSGFAAGYPPKSQETGGAARSREIWLAADRF